MARRGWPVFLLRRPDGSYLVRCSGRISRQTHEIGWAASLPSEVAAQAAAARLESWDRARLDRLGAGDRLLACELCGEAGWTDRDRAVFEALEAGLAAAPPELTQLVARLRSRDAGGLAACERALAGSGLVQLEWVDDRFGSTLPVHRGAELLALALAACRLRALRDGDESAAAVFERLEPLPRMLYGPWGELPA